MTVSPKPTQPAVPTGRIPTQRRARERVDRILSVASDLIAERGSDRMTMSDVADNAGVSIGSLYQYFPDKSAIVRALAQRSNEASRQCIEQALQSVHGRESLRAAFVGLVDQYYEICLSEPVMRDIWSATQVDRELQQIELAESRTCGNLLADALKRVRPAADRKQLETSAFLIWHLGEAAVRLATSLPRKEGAAVMAAYKRMALAELLAA